MKVSKTDFPTIYAAFHTIAHDAGATSREEPFPDSFDVDESAYNLTEIEQALSGTLGDHLSDFLIGDADDIENLIDIYPDLYTASDLINRFYDLYIASKYEGSTITAS